MATPLNWAQKEAVQAVAADLSAHHRKVYVDMPTRAGKTAVPLHILEILERNGGCPSVTFVAERKEQVRNILDQASMFAPTLVQKGLIAAHTSASLKKCTTLPRVRVMTYMGRTAAVLDGTLNPADEAWLIEDEAQHVLSELRQDTHNRNPRAIHIALTASPEYSEDKGLPQAGYKLSYGLSRQKAIDGRLNAQTRSVVVEMNNIQGSLDDIARTASDFSPDELERLVRQTEVMENMGNFAAHWHSPVDPRPIYQRDGFIFCTSIADAIATADYWNKRFGEGSCAAVWGDMSPSDQASAIQAHEEGRIKWLASSDFAVEGMGKNHHDVVINKVPTLSAVRAKQRGGRVTGYDNSNPDKEALIADLVYPSERGDQLLYGDAIGGFLFESRERNERKPKGDYVPNLTPLPIIKGLAIAAMPNTVETFLHRRTEKRELSETRYLQRYTENIRDRMQATGLLSFNRVWAKVQDIVETFAIEDGQSKNKQISAATIKSLMMGEGAYEDETFLEYRKAAVALAAALNTRPEWLFGHLSRTGEDGHEKPLRPIDYKERDLIFDTDTIEPGYTPEAFKPLTGQDDDILEGIWDMEDFDKVWDEAIDWDATEEPEQAVYESQLRDKMPHYLNQLNERERLVVKGRYGFGQPEMTLEELGNVLGTARERPRQIEFSAIRKLKKPSVNIAALLPMSGQASQDAYQRTQLNMLIEEQQKVVLQEQGLETQHDTPTPSYPDDTVDSRMKDVIHHFVDGIKRESFGTVIQGLEALMDIHSSDDSLSVSEFKERTRYSPNILMFLVERGYTWDAQNFINTPYQPVGDGYDDSRREWHKKSQETAQRLLEVIELCKQRNFPRHNKPFVQNVRQEEPVVVSKYKSIPEVIIEAARHYREKFKNEDMNVVIEALEAGLGVQDGERHWYPPYNAQQPASLEGFKKSHRYDASHIIKMAQKGYDWGANAILEKPSSDNKQFEHVQRKARRFVELLNMYKERSASERER